MSHMLCIAPDYMSMKDLTKCASWALNGLLGLGYLTENLDVAITIAGNGLAMVTARLRAVKRTSLTNLLSRKANV